MREVLPLSLPPRGLNRIQAAAYVGISANFFDQLVKERTMPAPRTVGSRRVWDRLELDVAFSRLPKLDGTTPTVDHDGDGVANPWDDE